MELKFGPMGKCLFAFSRFLFFLYKRVHVKKVESVPDEERVGDFFDNIFV